MITLTFLILATEWDSANGGVSTFNRELCSALAALKHRVYCGVSAIGPGERERALEVGVQLLVPRRVPGLTGVRSLMLPFDGLPEIDVVIGHGRVTGSEARAQVEVHHRSAKHVHFIHTDARAIEPFKKRKQEPMLRAENYVNTEVELCRLADFVAAVGPELQSAFATYLHPYRKPVHSFLPGLFANNPGAAPPPRPTCLVFGRADDDELKGIGLAAIAMGEVGTMEDLRHARFVVRGVQEGDEDDLRNRLMGIGGAKLPLVVEPYSSDRTVILNSIRQTTLVLMPSQEEGFGLSALEAISECVPVLISKKSGLARAMEQHVPSLAAASTVDVRDGSHVLVQRIRAVLIDDSAAFERARALREAMAPHFDWIRSAREFVDALRADPSGPTTPTPPSTPPGLSATDALVKAFAEASSHVLAWHQTLRSGNEWIERPELASILDYARNGGEGPLVLLGAPGTGKSALLARAAHELVAENTVVLAIKADRLPASVNSLDALAAELGLPTDVESALIASSGVRNTVLIIDQMDALADLVDVETRRLDVLLDLVERVSKNESIRIVMSCRAFDFEHDVRLRRLKADELKLSPPDPTKIDIVLAARGIAPALLAPRTRDLLNTMQALDVFLQVTPARRTEPGMNSYQRLLEALWNDRLAGRLDRVALERSTEQLARRMADREELWLSDAAISTIEIPPAHVRDLQAVGILSREDGRVAFSHQTLFEFARARHFLANESSLPAYVRARQTSLFVRPTLWTTLAYLRATDTQPYLQQLEELWLDKDLRPHLHRLLIDFVGQVEFPDPRETLLLLPSLHDDRWRGVTIEAITGRAEWFEAVRSVELPTLMRGAHANMVTGLLAQAISFAPDAVADLIEHIWLPIRARHPSIANVLFYAPSWPERFQTLAIALVEGGTSEHSAINALVQSAIAMSPPTASRIIALDLAERRATVRKETDASDDAGRRSAYRDLLDSVGRIDSLVDVAAADPEGFAAFVWPWFVSVLRDVAHSNGATRYREDYSLGASLESGSRELPQALHESLATCAKQAGFVAEFVERWSNETTLAVHRFIVATIEAALPEASRLAVAYLLGDARRMNIGDLSFHDGLSARLIRDVAPLLDEMDRERLEVAILNSETLSPSVYKIEDRRYVYDSNRRHRLRLMRALGEHASSKLKKLREEESRRFPGDDEGFDPTLREIKSPVSAEQILRAKNEDILRLFEQLPDLTEDRHPEQWTVGGSIQASEAFATAAKQDPDRFFRMLQQFVPGVSEEPVTRALFALAEVEPLSRIEAAVLQLLDLGFFKHAAQRSDVAFAVEKAARGSGKVKSRPQISDRVRILLESWLDAAQTLPPKRTEQKDEPERTDVIIGSFGGGGLPSGNYPILDALTTAYLDKAEPDVDGWMRILEAHVVRTEDPNVWLALSSQLHNVLFADPSRAERFLDTLFTRFPMVRDSRRGITIIARSMARLPASTIEHWMAGVEVGNWTRKSQAVGELLGWFATRHDAMPTSRDRLAHEVIYGSEPFRRGIAYAAAALWHYPERRLAATNVLIGLMPTATPSIAEALMSTFQLEPPLLDDSTRRLLRALADSPQVIMSDKSFGLMEALRELLPSEAEIVAITSLSLVQFSATQSDQMYTLSRGTELIDIAMTLQRLGPRFRAQGLDLFELLLAQNAYGVRDVLANLDPASRRSPARPRRVPRRPRRGRRRFS